MAVANRHIIYNIPRSR